MKPRVLIVVDSPGWAHDKKSEALVAHLGDEFDVHKCFHADLDPADLDRQDLIVVWYWMQLAGSPEICAALERNREKLVLGICSHAELQGEKGPHGIALLKEYGRALFVHNRLLLEEWRRVFDKPLYLTPNGVDIDFFRPSPKARRPGPLRVGWAGSLDNFGRELRGYDLIVEACAGLDGVEFVPAIKEEWYRDSDEMLIWYQDLDVYVCASRCEGTPNPCLEAAACGLPLVTTAVGNMPELLVDGVGGYFVERSVASIRAAIQALEADPVLRTRMSLANLKSIQEWSWIHRAEAFRQLLRDCLRREAAPI
jgi:glycosyltransferase involved in cell wall biosynthesis